MRLHRSLAPALALAAAAALTSPVAPAAAADTTIATSTFETGTQAWYAERGAVLSRVDSGQRGWVARLTATRSGAAVLNDKPDTVAETRKGATYRASAWVRTSTPGLIVTLRLTEHASGAVHGTSAKGVRLAGTGWQQVAVTHTARTSGSRVGVKVSAPQLPEARSYDVDDVRVSTSATTATLPVVSSFTGRAGTPSHSRVELAWTASGAARYELVRAGTATPVWSGTATSATLPADPGARYAYVLRAIGRDGGVTTSSAVSVTTTGVRIGMATPRDEWDSRLTQTGQVGARRLFGQLNDTRGLVAQAASEIAAGRLPILSFKVPGNDWAGAGAGTYDAQLRDLTARLAALPGESFVTLHHEPTGDGTPEDYVAMQRRALPILGAPANVDAGVIVNGFWWSAKAMGYTDAEIARWLPADVLRLAEVVASDTYQGGYTHAPGEDAAVKIRRMSAWADRVGVERLGIGEYNGLNAAAITAAGDAVLADPRYVFAACFNSSQNNRPGVDWTLEGDRLEAFKETVAKSAHVRTA